MSNSRINKRHNWNGAAKNQPARDANKGGMAEQCIKCGCVKEFVKGIPTYFIDDTVYDKIAPACDERLLKSPNQ